jgi:hypothetical protein
MFPRRAARARRRGLERVLDRYLDLEAHPAAQPGLRRLPARVMRRPLITPDRSNGAILSTVDS